MFVSRGSVRGLETGLSREVSGVLVVEDRTASPACPAPRILQYRLTEKSLTLFPPGTSRAVL